MSIIKSLKRLLGIKPKYVTPPWYPYIGKPKRPRKPGKVKEFKPPFPGGTFVYSMEVYDNWNNRLLDEGWTKKEVKRGWRWKKNDETNS